MNSLFVIAGFFLATVSLARSPDDSKNSAPADLVLPVPGAPLSAEQIEERTHKNPDGTSVVERIEHKIYRDSAGRLRIESVAPGASGHPAPVLLLDPTSGSRAILMVEERIALRIVGPKSGEDGFAVGFGGIGDALPPGNWKTHIERLGTRVIEELQCEGTRITQTSEQQTALGAVTERWYSSGLKLTAMAVSSGPSGTHTARVHNLLPGEPDASLFSVPPEYTIQDVDLVTRER